jgi:hypothetical protein
MGRPYRVLVVLALCLTPATAAAAVAAPTPSAAIQLQDDRRLGQYQEGQIEPEEKALELQLSMERNLVPTFDRDDSGPGIGSTGLASAVPGRGVGVLVALLLGLTGGLVGGCAALAGWLVATGRRGRRATSTA